MIPVDNFYPTLYANLFNKTTDTHYIYLTNFTSVVTASDLVCSWAASDDNVLEHKDLVWFHDQEPLLDDIASQIKNHIMTPTEWQEHKRSVVFANSEHSPEKDQFIAQNGFRDWYYFYHGFAALDWYRDQQYLPAVDFAFDRVFMSLNHLMTRDRSYRMTLVAQYIDNGILDHGIVSLPLSDVNGTVKTEIFSADTKLSKAAKKLVYRHIMPLEHGLVADTEFPAGYMSAQTDFDFMRQAFWHVVAETVFYHKKLHLTEKIFKPIVARRPFILVAAPGNLAYLKSYGFKTFDKWIDESYDMIQDDDQRIEKIVEQLVKLCNMSKNQLLQMHTEMAEVLEYNYCHFYYGGFKQIIVDELLTNINCQDANVRQRLLS